MPTAAIVSPVTIQNLFGSGNDTSRYSADKSIKAPGCGRAFAKDRYRHGLLAAKAGKWQPSDNNGLYAKAVGPVRWAALRVSKTVLKAKVVLCVTGMRLHRRHIFQCRQKIFISYDDENL